jgi:hypothetical protein
MKELEADETITEDVVYELGYELEADEPPFSFWALRMRGTPIPVARPKTSNTARSMIQGFLDAFLGAVGIGVGLRTVPKS